MLKKSADGDEFLVVKRPDSDPDMAGCWGFPAVTLKSGELFEQAAQRVCVEKLGCQASAVRFLGLMFQKRNSYDIFLSDIEMVLSPGTQPNVHKANSKHTVYVDQKWSSDPNDLMESAQKGSCCSTIFLTDRGILTKADWINSLEGSPLVG